MTESTLLRLTGIGVPPYSARGLQQTLEPIDAAANLRRTVNGKLRDLSLPRFQKYKSTISGNDQTPPACDGVWAGHLVTVDCIQELCFEEYGLAQREVVEDSERTEAGFTFYRPRLIMMVMSFTTSKDEYQGQVPWRMDLEER
jgi:hypothetical protein